MSNFNNFLKKISKSLIGLELESIKLKKKKYIIPFISFLDINSISDSNIEHGTNINFYNSNASRGIDTDKVFILMDTEKEILLSHNIDPLTWETKHHGKIGLSLNDDNIIIVRTSDSSWRALAGREWQLNRKTLEWKLTAMN